MLLMWNRHVGYVFEQGMLTQHAMSLDHFKQMLSVKREGTVETVVSKMAGQVFSLRNPYLAVLLLSVVLFILTLVFFKDERCLRGLLIFGVACYLIYQAGMLGMYVFTMQEKEALRLASYDRYHGTIWIFSAGIALIAALRLMDAVKDKRAWASACCALCVLALAVSGMPHYTHYTRYMDEDALEVRDIRARADSLIAQYALPEGASYYILVDDDFTPTQTAYLYNMANCLLLAEDVQVRKLDKLFNPEEVNKYDYAVAFGGSDAIRDYIKETYGSDDSAVPTAAQPPRTEPAAESTGSKSRRNARGRRG